MRYSGAAPGAGPSRTPLSQGGAIAKSTFAVPFSYDRVTHIPIYELAFIWGVGPVEEPRVNLIRAFAYSGALEDVKLKRP